jgi:hypothetical protein
MSVPVAIERPTAHPLRNPWIFDPLLGIALGLPILGIGGRVAMRIIAHATNVAPSFSVGGTVTVVLLGAASGAAGGLIYAVMARAMPRRTRLRMAAFGIVLTLLTLRGASPFSALTLSVFLPLTLLFGAVLDSIHRRRFAVSALT